jgi:hypothetical protein
MSWAALNELLWFGVATYITLLAFGWLPASRFKGSGHPALKRVKILGPLGMLFMFIEFLRHLR